MTHYPAITKAKYIFDTSPVIMLLEKCQLRSSFLRFAENNILSVPHRVMEEYAIGDGENPKPNMAAFREVFSPIDVKLDSKLLPFFYNEDTSGEIWVISYARQYPEYYCVIDEMFARNICNLLNVKVIGAIGIIKAMKVSGLLNISDLRTVRNKIKNCRFYLSRELLNELDRICQL